MDGESKASGNAGTHSFAGMTLGCRYSADVGALNGKMAEFVLYGGTMADRSRNSVGSDLAREYGLTCGYVPVQGTLISIR